MVKPRRSVIYRLGDDPSSYATAKDLQVDVLLFDLEDSVSPPTNPPPGPGWPRPSPPGTLTVKNA